MNLSYNSANVSGLVPDLIASSIIKLCQVQFLIENSVVRGNNSGLLDEARAVVCVAMWHAPFVGGFLML